MAYYEEDYLDEAYDEFWDGHKQLAAKVPAIRNIFYREERTFLHGFCESERENTDDADLEVDNRDCLHMMRICKRWQNVDVEKFLTATKREYLPMMIRFFIARPKEDVFERDSEKQRCGAERYTTPRRSQRTCLPCLRQQLPDRPKGRDHRRR
jgi:hypothetical protein